MANLTEEVALVREKTIEILGTYFMDEASSELAKIKELKKNPELSQSPNLLQEITIYESLLKFVVFQTLSEVEQTNLFSDFLVKAFKVGLDVKNRFSIKMSLVDEVLWPETTQLFVEAMLKNEEKIGKNKIIIIGEHVESPPTFANWLRDYNRINGMDRHEKIIPYKYINENQNAIRLEKEDKFLLLKLLEFYEGLKFPSQKQIQDALDQVLDQYASSLSDDELGLEAENEKEVLISEIKEDYSFSENTVSEGLNSLLKKFPQVEEQIIGKYPIKLINSGESVRPSIGNWLSDYRTYAGVGPHEVNERSDYLVRSRNVQNLSSADREKLGLTLRSYDEDYPLPFSRERQVILFK